MSDQEQFPEARQGFDETEAGLPQLCRRERLIELDDAAIRLQRPEWVAEPLDHRPMRAQEASTEHHCDTRFLQLK
jgi:hypothetical protein